MTSPAQQLHYQETLSDGDTKAPARGTSQSKAHFIHIPKVM